MTTKTQDAVITTTAAELDNLVSNGKVNIVFHGDINSSAGKIISSIAKADHYNTYLHLSDSSKEGTVEIYRPFGDVVSYPNVDEGVKNWINLHERPSVYAFDNRTIGQIFTLKKPAVILFESATDGLLQSTTFKEAADLWRSQGHSLIFTKVDASNENYKNLVGHIKIDPVTVPLVYISRGEKVKYVLFGTASDLTVQQITAFLNSVNEKSARKYNLDEQVKIKTPGEEEL